MGIAVFVGLLFFAIGILVLISGVISVVKQRRQMAHSLSATGLVTGLASEMSKSGYLYHPLVQFRTALGQTMSFQSAVGSSPADYSVGQQVKVLYDARNPLYRNNQSSPAMLLEVPFYCYHLAPCETF